MIQKVQKMWVVEWKMRGLGAKTPFKQERSKMSKDVVLKRWQQIIHEVARYEVVDFTVACLLIVQSI